MGPHQVAWLLSTFSGILLKESAGDFVKLRKDDGKWWFIDPDGEKMLSYSVTSVAYENSVDVSTGVDDLLQANEAKFHGNRGEWARETMALLKDHEFNTVGPWSRPEIALLYSTVTPSGFWALETGDEYTISGATMTLTKGFSVGKTFTVRHAAAFGIILISGTYGGGSATFTSNTMTWTNGAIATRIGSIPDGWWAFKNGDKYSITGTTLTLEEGFRVGRQFVLSDVTSSSLVLDGEYGDGSATFTSESMTWANGQTATRTTRKAMYYTPIMGIGGSFCRWQSSSCFPDVFCESFATHAAKMAREQIGTRDDELLLGWFTDNELYWTLVGGKGLLQYFQSLPESAPGRQAVDEFLAGEPDSESYAALSYKWTRQVSAKYHSTVAAAMRAADPNHLLLGIKFISQYHAILDPVVEGACPYVDAFSFNIYAFTPGHAYLDHYYELCGKPIIIGETGFKATENLSGNPNTKGAGPLLPTQKARAKAFEAYARKLFSKPYGVGFNFFTFADEPVGGRGNGEDGNYGLVSLSGQPYRDVLSTARAVFSSALSLHEVGQVANKCPLDRLDYYSGAEGFLLSSVGNLCLTANPSGTVGLASCAKDESQPVEPFGNWVLPSGDEYSISGMLMTLTKGFGVGGTFEVSDVTPNTFKIDSDYGHGSATYTSSVMTWANGITAHRKDANQGVNNQLWQVIRVGGRAGFRLKNKGTQGCLHHMLYGNAQHDLLANGQCDLADSLDRFPFAPRGPPAWEHDNDCSLMQICNTDETKTWASGVCRYESSCVAATRYGTAQAKTCEAGLAQQEFAFVDGAADAGLDSTSILYQ